MSKQTNQMVEKCRSLIRTAGLRATPGRIAVLSLLFTSTRPMTHAAVVEKVGNAGADPSTIFRALNDMAEAGLLRRMELGDHVYRYEVANVDGNQHNDSHAHFLCTECGEILCLDNAAPQAQSAKDPRIKAVTEVLLKGQCKDCE